MNFVEVINYNRRQRANNLFNYVQNDAMDLGFCV